MSLKRAWILLMEPLGSHLLMVGSLMRQINSCTTLLSCASLMPLLSTLLGCQGREGKAVCAAWSTLVRFSFVLLETGTKLGVLVLLETVPNSSCLIPPLLDRSDISFTFLKWYFNVCDQRTRRKKGTCVLESSRLRKSVDFSSFTQEVVTENCLGQELLLCFESMKSLNVTDQLSRQQSLKSGIAFSQPNALKTGILA